MKEQKGENEKSKSRSTGADWAGQPVSPCSEASSPHPFHTQAKLKNETMTKLDKECKEQFERYGG